MYLREYRSREERMGRGNRYVKAGVSESAAGKQRPRQQRQQWQA
jgi:hypothetical protein